MAGKSQSLRGDGMDTLLTIDTRFDPTVTTGVILVTGSWMIEISDLAFQFAQPLDLIKTASAASAAGTNTITVSNATGIVMGMTVLDRTQRPNAIPGPTYRTGHATTVTGIAGNVLTLSANITAPGVSNGDTLQFASVRSQFKTLAGGATTTPGGTGVMYPWAIYANSAAASMRIHNIMTMSAWNGVYVRG